MLFNKIKKIFFKEKDNNKIIKNILNNIIEISYSISLNKKYNISDTFKAKYETIILLIFLFYIRCKSDEKLKSKIQLIYDFLFEYIDYSLREIGTGDLTVGKKIKKLARIFSIRLIEYEKAVKKDFKNIKPLIKKNIFKNKIGNSKFNFFYKSIYKAHKKIINANSNKVFVNNYINNIL
tara:strand:- start:9 stop:545 length:537 start_codon:yes stop_codon:yes gene_type:complete